MTLYKFLGEKTDFKRTHRCCSVNSSKNISKKTKLSLPSCVKKNEQELVYLKNSYYYYAIKNGKKKNGVIVDVIVVVLFSRGRWEKNTIYIHKNKQRKD